MVNMENGDIRISVDSLVGNAFITRYYNVPNIVVGKILLTIIKKECSLYTSLSDSSFGIQIYNDNEGGWNEWTGDEGNAESNYKINDKFQMVFEDTFS